MNSETPLPTGTVTFLFTDVEGSTRLWEQHPEAMQAALARHDALAATIIPQHGGTLVKHRGEGDSLFAVFARTVDAVSAVSALQQALHAETWPADAPLRVRMALHTGDAALREGDYRGPTVNRCARVRAVAHGGQVLLSQATAALLRGQLPPEIQLRDLGSHRLKDLQQPEHLFQLLHPCLPDDFPPLRSLEAFAHNLPRQVTRFIGREKEMAEVKQLLSSTALLTLTGSGGCGKTRLALQVAAERLEGYPDGVWLVELAALADPALVPQTVAAALGVREEPGRTLITTLADYLRPKSLLLILDNCEHLLSASAQLAETLLRQCPRATVLASSREGLGIAGETLYLVPSLSLPPSQSPTLPSPLSTLYQSEAVQLFMDRAAAMQPGFAVTSRNAPAVAEVCHRLDGIPLAIELAAVRVRALPVEQIAGRLNDRFRLLTGGSRTALPRQQTLRALIDWSHDLLSEPEQLLFRRLSVFAGGWTLAAAEAVCGSAGERGQGSGVSPTQSILTDLTPGPRPLTPDVLDLLTALVEKSLVIYEEPPHRPAGPAPGEGGDAQPPGGGAARYRMLETVRQYSRDRLFEADEGAAVRRRHSDWAVALAERAGPELFGPAQREWLDRLEGEHDNLRAALEWSAESGAVEAGLRIGAAIWRFWHIRGYRREGRERLERLLARPEAAGGTPARARSLDAAGVFAFTTGDRAAGRLIGRAHYEEMLAIGEALQDGRISAAALNGLGEAAFFETGSREAARPFHERCLVVARAVNDRWDAAVALLNLNQLEESLALYRELGDQRGVCFALLSMGDESYHAGDYQRARSLFEESLAIRRELDDRGNMIWELSWLGLLAREQGNFAAARARSEEALAVSRQTHDTSGIAWALGEVGVVAYLEGDVETARSRYEETLERYRELGDKLQIAGPLNGLGEVARQQGDLEAARSLHEEVLALRPALKGLRAHPIAVALLNLGIIAQSQGDGGQARARYRDSMAEYQELRESAGMASCLEALAGLAAAEGEPERAAQLFGAAAARRAALGIPVPPVDRADYQHRVADVRAALGENLFTASWAEGQAMPIGPAIALALDERRHA